MTRDSVARVAGRRRHWLRREAVRAVPFHDWVGKAMLQENIAFGRRLEALAGLDGNRWLAVGLSVEPGCGASTIDRVFIDAVDLNSLGIKPHESGFHDLVALADQYGALPVTRIHLEEITLRDLFGYMTHGHLCLQAAGVAETQLNVVAQWTHTTERTPSANR